MPILFASTIDITRFNIASAIGLYLSWRKSPIASLAEQTGILIEALNYEGYRHVLPTYQENTLKKRYATSEDTSKMLDIIFANRVISLSYLYGDVSLNFLGKVVPNNTIASYIESISKKEQTTIDQIIALHSSDETK